MAKYKGVAVHLARRTTMTPEEIAATLEAMDKMESFDMTDEEREAAGVERRARKEWEKADFEAHAEKLRRLWE